MQEVKKLDLGKALPPTVRKLIRNGNLKRFVTPLFCEGYQQANIVILPSSLAGEFEKFAKGNSGSIPLLYTSKPGELGAPNLCKDSDIRTDVPLYKVIKKGVVEAEVEHLKDFDMSDMVTFYIGCSFSFYQALLDNSVTRAKAPGENVSMYKTNIDCYPSGPFKCKMVVSMQSVHESKLNMAADVTNCMKNVHGAPIHFGSPETIGIEDISKVDFGDATVIEEGSVPVFWCCGVTGLEALQSANVDLSFTHSPGHMFLTDVPQDVVDKQNMTPETLSEVVKISTKNQQYSMLSNRALAILEEMTAVINQRKPEDGVPRDFVRASLALSHAQSLALVPGFLLFESVSPDVTHGSLGIISLAASLQSMGKNVTLFVDAHTLNFNKSFAERCYEAGLLPKELRLISFQQDHPPNGQSHHFDVILALESVVRVKDVKLFDVVSVPSETITILIEDKEKNLRTRSDIDENFQPQIPADLVLAADTSNLGCYAFGLALYVLRSCSIHDRFWRKAIGYPSETKTMERYMPSCAMVKAILEVIENVAGGDGKSTKQTKFDEERSDCLKDLRSMVGLVCEVDLSILD